MKSLTLLLFIEILDEMMLKILRLIFVLMQTNMMVHLGKYLALHCLEILFYLFKAYI